MRFKLFCTSDHYTDTMKYITVEPKTAEDFITIANSFNHPIIIETGEFARQRGIKADPYIEVYDDWRE